MGIFYRQATEPSSVSVPSLFFPIISSSSFFKAAFIYFFILEVQRCDLHSKRTKDNSFICYPRTVTCIMHVVLRLPDPRKLKEIIAAAEVLANDCLLQ